MAYKNLTSKEKSYLKDALEMENLCLAKYNVFADQCQDTDLKKLLFDLSKNKRQHADGIKDILNYSHHNLQ